MELAKSSWFHRENIRINPVRASDMQRGVGDAPPSHFPLNTLRNAGLHLVVSSHFLCVDIDQWPSEETLPSLERLLDTEAARWNATLGGHTLLDPFVVRILGRTGPPAVRLPGWSTAALAAPARSINAWADRRLL